jgi:hypothetical protein
MLSMDRRRAVLLAGLGFLQLADQPAELVSLRRWLDSWAGLGDVIAGLTRQGLNVELRQFPTGWRANLYPTGTARSIITASTWERKPWRAVQHAGWSALKTQCWPASDFPLRLGRAQPVVPGESDVVLRHRRCATFQ